VNWPGRLLAVVTAYGCAVIGAVLVLIGLFTITQGVSDGAQTSELLIMLAFFGSIAAIYALPVAVPTIGLTEWKRVGSWTVFAAAGLVLGLLLTAAFTEIPYRSINFELAGTMIASSLTGAMTYWLVAWKLLPPRLPLQSSAG
jgi:hypothetical protein